MFHSFNESFIVMATYFMLPTSVSRGDYGQWTAFLALLVRLFFFIPGRVTKTTHDEFSFCHANKKVHTLFVR